MANYANNQSVESSGVLVKLLDEEDPRVLWESLPERSRLPREEGDDYIRLLEIKPSGINYLSIDIRFYKLSTAPAYTALSYVWGTDSRDFCQMDNLNSCLAHIGLHRPGLWWIDAICINQADTEEKNHQVALMRYIYERASRVYAWLGRARHNEWKVIQLFKSLEKSLIQRQAELSHCKIRWDNMNLNELNLEDIDSDVWPKLINFFGRAYFSRTWVLQELMFEKGRNNVMFGCGQLECHASAVWRSVHFFHSNDWIRAIHEKHRVFGDSRWDKTQTHIEHQVIGSLRDWHNVHMHTKIVSTMHANGSIPLRTLILATAEFETREPRDKILALLSMTRVSNISAYGIRVDYSQPVEDLYRDITGCLTMKTQSYHLLALSQDPSKKRIPRLPSWVPDYSMPSLGIEIGDSITKSGNLSSTGSISWSQGSATLGVKAWILDEIEVVAERSGIGLQAIYLLEWLQMLAKYLEVDIKVVLYRLLDDWKEGDLDVRKPVDRMIYHLLCVLLDETSAIQEDVRHFAAFLFQNPRIIGWSGVTEWKDMIQLAESNTERGLLGQATRFLDHAKSLTANVNVRRFFITKSGRAGLGPVRIRKGDVVSQLDGRYVLNCLRPNGSGHYSLLDGPLFNSGVNAPFIKRAGNPSENPEWQNIFLD